MLRGLTTLLMVAAVVLTLALPLEFASHPDRGAPLAVRQVYAADLRQRLWLHLGGLIVCLVGAGAGGVAISQQAKREYREAAKQNLLTLVEGKRSDES